MKYQVKIKGYSLKLSLMLQYLFLSQRMSALKSFFVFLVLEFSLGGHVYASDSIFVHSVVRDTVSSRKLPEEMDHIGESRLFRATYVGVPLIAGGLIVKREDTKFRKLRNDFLPEFHRPLDNYLQITPAAVMLGLKAFGVPSRSSWGRMAVSDAFAVTMLTGVVQGLKMSTQVTRPDGSDNHSFPSGHTATAFMAATMLSKEYGYLSPWVSIGAYSVATATGLMRVANNKHWLSDVMVGAGVGILSTEFGYWIGDVLMKDKGLNIKEARDEEILGYGHPSFLGLYIGFNVPLSKYDLSEEITFRTSTGTTMGVEGAYFFNKNIGIGGRATISNLQYIVNGTEAAGKTFDFYSACIGPYFSFPLTARWFAGTKFLAGYTFYPRTIAGGNAVPYSSGLGIGSGLNLNLRVKRHLDCGVFLDYNLQPPHSISSGEYMHTMTLGGKAVVRF